MNMQLQAQTVLTSKQIVEALRERHPASEWFFFAELRLGTGFARDAEQRLDAWAMHAWPSSQFRRVAYEVKVSRSDYQRELKNPRKRRPALLMSNEFYFAVPSGLINIAELPPEAGLIEVNADGSCHTTLAAPWRDALPPTWLFLAAIVRRALKEGGTA
jgi:hypothetical protein